MVNMSLEERIAKLEQAVTDLNNIYEHSTVHASGDTSHRCVSLSCRTCTGVFLWRLQSCTGWRYEGKVSIREG